MDGVQSGRKGEQDAVAGGSEKMLTSAFLSLVVEMYVDLAPPHVKSRLFGLLLHYLLLCMCSRVSSVAGSAVGVGGAGGGGGGGRETEGEVKQLWKAGAEALLSTALSGGTGTHFRESSS